MRRQYEGMRRDQLFEECLAEKDQLAELQVNMNSDDERRTVLKHIEINEPEKYREKMKGYVDPKQIYGNIALTDKVWASEYG